MDQRLNARSSPRERRLAGFLAHRQPFGVDELDVRDTEEAQEIADVRGLRIERRARIDAAARRDDVGFLPGEQPDRTLLGIAKVSSARPTWSKYALSVEGTPKL
jgi:hypothetical protein